MTIQRKREVRIEESAGPGQYDTERAVSATKTRQRSALISKEKRVETFALKEQIDSCGPGQYEEKVQFGKDNTKSFRIGTKSVKKIETTAGPG